MSLEVQRIHYKKHRKYKVVGRDVRSRHIQYLNSSLRLRLRCPRQFQMDNLIKWWILQPINCKNDVLSTFGKLRQNKKKSNHSNTLSQFRMWRSSLKTGSLYKLKVKWNRWRTRGECSCVRETNWGEWDNCFVFVERKSEVEIKIKVNAPISW